MSDLRGLVTKLGFADARSLLQSGNLVFRSDGRTSAEIERMLEIGLEKRLRIRTDSFVRSAAQWKAVIATNPFRKEAERDPAHLVAMFLKRSPAAKQVAALEQAIVGREEIRAQGSVIYIVYPDGIGKSKLTNLLVDRKLETRGTGRNWNTVLKLAAMSEE